jgi:hypothetical protein
MPPAHGHHPKRLLQARGRRPARYSFATLTKHAVAARSAWQINSAVSGCSPIKYGASSYKINSYSSAFSWIKVGSCNVAKVPSSLPTNGKKLSSLWLGAISTTTDMGSWLALCWCCILRSPVISTSNSPAAAATSLPLTKPL